MLPTSFFFSDIFLPSPDNLLVNVHESKELVIDLLNQLPTLFEDNQETGNALGAALQAAYKMMVSVFFCYIFFPTRKMLKALALHA